MKHLLTAVTILLTSNAFANRVPLYDSQEMRQVIEKQAQQRFSAKSINITADLKALKDCTYNLRIQELEYDSTASAQQQQQTFERPCDAEIEALKGNSMIVSTQKIVNAIKEGVGEAERDFQSRRDIRDVNFDEIYESAKGAELIIKKQQAQQQEQQQQHAL